ncbi:MAG: hypothetical protein QNK23_07375 [Crocinitomicaceae bacterium]|nr:hypothetical protein [Crocinitomicaceae bacterium]
MEKTQNSEKVMGSNNIIGDMEFNRFGLISAILLIVGCLGGFAVGLGAVEHIWSLILVVVPTMTTLALLLSVGPMKYIFIAGIVACAIDLMFIAYFLFT